MTDILFQPTPKKDRWKWEVMKGPRGAKRAKVWGRQEVKKIYPPKDHRWLRVTFWDRGKRHSRFVAVPAEYRFVRNRAKAELMARRLRERVLYTEGI